MTGEGAAVVGLQCAVCRREVDIATPLAWRCPNSTFADRHHVLQLVASEIGESSVQESVALAHQGTGLEVIDDSNPFVRYGPRLAWWAFARANGLADDDCIALTRDVAAGFTVTPFERSVSLSDGLRRSIWVKNETDNVGGSHKARHLVTIMLHLRAAETLGMLRERPRLAIASCGNAAIAAATLAARSGWPLDVFVPDWASDTVLGTLDGLGAHITVCPRHADDPPGDPTVRRFREAVEAGAVPFSVQGPENAFCLDGGRTIGWEMADAASLHGVTLDRVYVQVGGGAFAACVGVSMGTGTVLHAVQAEGCAPLVRAWDRLDDTPVAEAAQRWSDYMWPWDAPASAADGIIDDETYDWLGVVAAMRATGGRPVVASEADIARAHELSAQSGIDASATGTAGLAGVIADLDRIGVDETVAVVFSGAAR